jgi:outer membrane receptor protein involved in Fe transport
VLLRETVTGRCRCKIAGVTLWILSCQFFLHAPVWAEPSSSVDNYNLETIYVSGAKPTVDLETTQKTTLSLSEKINAGQINNVTDLLRDLAGFTVLFNPNSGSQVTLRGVGGERFLVSINGSVLANQGGLMMGRGFAWDSIPVANIRKIEIIRGASSAIYAGTWGGVVNLVTIDNPLENRSDIKFSYGSFHTHKTTVATQGTDPNGKISWAVSANKGYSDGFYRNNWSNDENVNLNLAYKLNANDALTFTLTHDTRTEGIITGNNTKSTNGYDPNYPIVADPQTIFETSGKPWIDGSYRYWQSNNIALNYKFGDNKINLYQNTQYRTEWVRTVAAPALKENWNSYLVNNGLDWQQTKKFGAHHLTYGLQAQTMNYDLSSSQSLLKSNFSGVFLQDNWQIRPKWTMGLGVRYDYYKFNMDVNSSSQPQQPYDNECSYVSPKFSLVYEAGKSDRLFASISSVFRPPTSADYFRWSYNYFNWGTGSSGSSPVLGFSSQVAWQQALGKLEPEYGWSYELGWRKQVSDKLDWRVTGYYNNINNYINILISGATQKGYYPTYNIGNAKIGGLEFAMDYALDSHFGAHLAYSYQKGTKSGDKLNAGTVLNNIPESTYAFGLHYKNRRLQAALDMHYTGETPTAVKRLPGYSTTDLSLSYTLGKSVISLTCSNLFNLMYEEGGDPMPGRTISASWQQTF